MSNEAVRFDLYHICYFPGTYYLVRFVNIDYNESNDISYENEPELVLPSRAETHRLEMKYPGVGAEY